MQVNGVDAFLFYASPGQINFQVPWEVPAQQQVSLTVTVAGVAGKPATVNVAAFGPGVFTIGSSGQGAILIASTGEFAAPIGSVSGSGARPANRGEYITIYCTEIGAVTNQPASGAKAVASPLSETTATTVVTIGGVSAPVTFSGLAPGFLGLYQVNAQVPEGSPSGNAVPIEVSVGNVASKTTTIAVQ